MRGSYHEPSGIVDGIIAITNEIVGGRVYGVIPTVGGADASKYSHFGS